jgi:energy-coupling factor transporter ATP-binding protein EcfA2
MAEPISATADLRAALDALAEAIERVPFSLPGPVREERRARRSEAVWSIREYLISRLGHLDGPARVVIIGSTGSGKSTLLNSVAGYRITEPGALRPTTRHPVLWCHQRDEATFAFGFLRGYGTGADAHRPLKIVAGNDPILEGICILDAPDFDSIETEHRTIAEELLAIADVCVFVTSAQRYADAVPWEFLQRAALRGIPVIHLMNRMTPGGEAAAFDYRERLRGRGIPVNMFHTIDEQSVDPVHGGLPYASVERIVQRLTVLTAVDERERLARETTRVATRNAISMADGVLNDLHEERLEIDRLGRVVSNAYAAQLAEIERDLDSGTLIRSQVLDRWRDFLGTGELLRSLTEGVSRVREWLVKVFGGAAPVQQAEAEVKGELGMVVSRRAGRAATAVSTSWDLDPAGSSILRGTGYDLWHEDPETAERMGDAIDDWSASLLELVEAKGGDRRRIAQLASTGINAAAVTLTLAILIHTGGLTGTELGVTAGAAAVQQKVLEHLFGTAAAGAIVAEAKDSLLTAIRDVFAKDGQRFVALLDAHRAADLNVAIQNAIDEVEARSGQFYAD